jgi:hypothetical protein
MIAEPVPFTSKNLKGRLLAKALHCYGESGLHSGGSCESEFRSKYQTYRVRASKEDRQYLLQSDKTGHLATHKGTALKKIRRSP